MVLRRYSAGLALVGIDGWIRSRKNVYGSPVEPQPCVFRGHIQKTIGIRGKVLKVGFAYLFIEKIAQRESREPLACK